MPRPIPAPARQRGAVLILAMILLAVTTLITVSSFRMGMSGMQVIANAELQQQTYALANAAMEEAISSNLLFDGRTVFFCGPEEPNTRCWATPNGDTIAAVITDESGCVIVTPLPNDAPDADDPNLRGCFLGAPQMGAVAGAGSGEDSLCSEALWDVRARGEYRQPGVPGAAATVNIRQGIRLIVANDSVETACPLPE